MRDNFKMSEHQRRRKSVLLSFRIPRGLIFLPRICKQQVQEISLGGTKTRSGTSVCKEKGNRKRQKDVGLQVSQVDTLLDPRGRTEHKRALPLHLVKREPAVLPFAPPAKGWTIVHLRLLIPGIQKSHLWTRELSWNTLHTVSSYCQYI